MTTHLVYFRLRHVGFGLSQWMLVKGTIKFVYAKWTEKLVFFYPDDKKYYFKVMTFGLVNTPSFYSYLMGNLKKEWDILFVDIMESYAESEKELDGNKIHIVNEDIYSDPIKLYSGAKSIIDVNLVQQYCMRSSLFLMRLQSIQKI